LKLQLGTVSATAAATTTASTGVLDIVLRGNTTKFDGRAHVFGDFTLELLQFALGFEEVAGDLVGEEGVAGSFKLGDFRLAQFDPGALFVGEFVTTLMDALILKAGCVVGEEPLDLGLVLEERSIRDDLGAKFFGFRDNGGLFGNG